MKKAASPFSTGPATRAAPRGRPKVRPGALAPADSGHPEDAETRIYQSVVTGVMSQRLRPGTKLPEAALCELFGVGRSAVQKALQRLAHDHVVELRPNRGAIVAMPTREEVGMLFEARRALEAAILPLVAQSASRADFASLRRQLRDEHRAMHDYPQTEWARLASAFHLRLGELSRNPILARYLAEIISRCSLVVAIFQPPGNATCEHDEHARVVDFLEQGRVAEAVAEMDLHLRQLESHIQLVETQPELSLADMLGLG
ncbi:GntR family transcriptional regulator [Bordetella hinzii]|uniref:GntR family transcriptional regulator n=2 Tax=Bordetella hinzii TaxID=103855 RepID=A0AAN1RWN1_9BORD|nr:GntR family transcriptional regulator [Bordetella hinzii]AKQ62183.1 HTH-type transcriptional regulator LutR [Bordetella hinzii]AZW16913.1 GntR family transcriptional regulator [Bordetella hinzii]KCB23996.1 FCD domain protein [Bordetella hinzii OH87 BAL007II]KCB44513.1 FCD domain protein [Bordetella hinzii 4161]KCB45313.1 FCD domain protein [Bordetella hinzii 5132]